jgi:DNA polymerase
VIWLDTETFNAVPIKNGTYAYATTCEVMILTYAIDDGPVVCLDLTAGEHPYNDRTFMEAICDDDQIVTAHNSMFDRNVLRSSSNLVLDVPIHQWRDTMVQALSLALPGSLDKLCQIFKVEDDLAKMKDGGRLIHLFCKPRPKNVKIRRATRFTHPEDWATFKQYAINDTAAMREIARKMPIWNYKGNELALWHLDQEINDRGFAVDLDLAHAALRAVNMEQKILKRRTHELTGGAVASATQRDALLEHILEEYGFSFPDMTKDTLEKVLADQEVPEALKELVRVRLQTSTTSTAKYTKIIKSAVDGRLCGTVQFDGAGRTGRAAGRTVQPQNFPRPDMKAEEIDEGIEALKVDCADLIYPNVMSLTSNALRGCIVAAPGMKLVVSDLSNIEGRGVAYLAKEKWKLQAFRDYDAGLTEDLYQVSYGKAFGVPPSEAIGDKRQIGKVMELMLGYEGGVGAFLTGAATYRIDLDHMSRMAIPSIPESVWNEAVKFWYWCKKTKRTTYGLSLDVFCACDSLKRMWRAQHPEIVAFWAEVREATIMAIREPGISFTCRRVRMRRTGEWLRIILPSGRALCYPAPRVDDKGKISYDGVNQFSHKWGKISTYGGKLVENITQAFARDVFYCSKFNIEQAGYRIVLEVHDEFITEVPDSDEFSAEGLSRILSANPRWAPDIPLAAKGFETYRYRKG